MKKILITTSVALLSSLAIAEYTPVTQNELAIIVQAEKTAATELILAKNEANNLTLWETLDINKNGSISKVEAASSKEVFNTWDMLDTNQDNQLDTEEFAQVTTGQQ